jgi:hypothetical protein
VCKIVHSFLMRGDPLVRHFYLLPVLLTVSCLSGTAQDRKPVVTEKLYTEFFGPPGTLNEMILKADAVVRGRVVAAAPRDTDLPGKPGVRVRTAFLLQVLEVLHGSPGSPVDAGELSILREGGERDRGTYIERVVETGFPPFVIGQEYVLFLRREALTGAWQPAFGPDSVFQLSDGRVTSPGSSVVAAALASKTSEDLLRTIRTSRSRDGPPRGRSEAAAARAEPARQRSSGGGMWTTG